MKYQRKIEVPAAIWIRLRNASRNVLMAVDCGSSDESMILYLAALKQALKRADAYAFGQPLPEEQSESPLGRTQGDYLPRRMSDLVQQLETNIQGYLDGELPGPAAISGIREGMMSIRKEIASDYLRRLERTG
ncbi:hypothetical protein LCGC14_1043030 [marine sediment metagenome]|uniref:Uncharacterized protein n=1 Tax=marine sediment metagenome TaxID=412755 RepID=A0A0F9MR63_9ZZZZ